MQPRSLSWDANDLSRRVFGDLQDSKKSMKLSKRRGCIVEQADGAYDEVSPLLAWINNVRHVALSPLQILQSRFAGGIPGP